MPQTVFEYVILEVPTDEEQGKGQKPKILVPREGRPVPMIVAKEKHVATMIAARSIPEEFLERMDRIQIAVRPF